MRRLAALAAVLLLGAGSAQQVGDLVIPAPLALHEAGFAVAQAEQLVELVRSTRTITVAMDGGGTMERSSDLRVSLVILDLGPSTDVSPRQAIHISMFNDIDEHGIAWAVEPVAEVWTFLGATRTEAGIYVIDAEIPAYESGTAGCYFQKVRITVDARQLSIAVRSAQGVGEFEARRFMEPVGVSYEKVGCVR